MFEFACAACAVFADFHWSIISPQVGVVDAARCVTSPGFNVALVLLLQKSQEQNLKRLSSPTRFSTTRQQSNHEMNVARVMRTGPFRWAVVAPKQQQQQQLRAAALRPSSSAAAVATTQQDGEQPHYHHHRHPKGSSSPAPPRAAAVPPPPAWKVPAGQEASYASTTREHVVLPQDDELQLQHHQAGPVPPGDLRLVEFMEQVKMELWEFSAMPLRKRFRIQSLLR